MTNEVMVFLRSTIQNVSHQQPPNSVTPKARVLPSAPPVETSKPAGGRDATLDALAGAPAEVGGDGPESANGGPFA